MALKDDIALLQQLSIFRDMTEDHLRLLAFGADRRRLEPGHVLFRQGAQADAAFIVISGRLALTAYSPSLGEHQVGDATPGSILTEIAMIAEAERQFSAIAAEDSEVLRVSRMLFRRMLEEYPDVAVSLDRRLRENFNRLVAALEAGASKLDQP